MERSLTPTEREALLRLARASIEEELGRNGTLARALGEVELGPALHEPRACFVTLKAPATEEEGFRLRGCIGGITARDPLFRNVIRCAADAAFRDPRFPPVTREELGALRASVSVLAPLQPVASPDEIVPGTHGVVLEKESRQAVFLPQVAAEQGWDRDQLLEHLAMKAGLPRWGWRGARLWTFQAESFEEGNPGG